MAKHDWKPASGPYVSTPMGANHSQGGEDHEKAAENGSPDCFQYSFGSCDLPHHSRLGPGPGQPTPGLDRLPASPPCVLDWKKKGLVRARGDRCGNRLGAGVGPG